MVAMLWVLASGASAQEVNFTCEPRSGDRVIGVPPLQVTCAIDATAAVEWDTVTWLTGDGAVIEGDQFTHTYSDPGVFSVVADLEGVRYLVTDTGVPPGDQVIRREGYITTCDVPVAEFTYDFLGGRSYQLVNRSEFLVGCLDDVVWTVHEGSGRSEAPLLVIEGWDPLVELPADGTYTFILDLGGRAGASAAKITVDARYGLTDGLKGKPDNCSTSGGAAGWLFLPLMLLGRRRR